MHATFNYRLSKREYVVGMSALVDQLGRQDTGRTRRIIEQLAVLLVVVLGVTLAFPASAAGLWLAVLLIGIAQSLFTRRWARGASGQSYDPAVAEQEVEITDQDIVTRSPMRERRWSWAAVRRIHDVKDGIVLELVGWDMIVLPNRLWDETDRRRAFLDELRNLSTEAMPSTAPVKPALFDMRDLLRIGAIAAGVDVLALVVFNVSVYRGPSLPVSDAAFLGTFAALTLVGLGLAYLVYRFARPGLERLHDSAPRAAIGLCYALIWAVPAYVMIDYLRFGMTR